MAKYINLYEQHKKKYEREKARINNYILTNIQEIRNDQNITQVDNITQEEIEIIFKKIELELRNKEINIINKAVKFEYNRNKLKMFLNKEKYIEKSAKFYMDFLIRLKSVINKMHNIDNNFGLYYFTPEAHELTKILLEKHKKQRITSGLIISYMVYSYKFYSDITKELYALTHNKEEWSKIYNYEKIRRDNIIKQMDNQNKIIKTLGENVKTLTYNVNNEIDKGFFGL